MTSHSSSPSAGRSIGRDIIVVLLGLFVILSTLPGLSLLWDPTDITYGPQGPLGFSADYDGAVKAVAHSSAAWEAGIRPGDHVDLQRTPFESRIYVAGSPARLPAGKPVTIWVVHGRSERLITLVAPTEPYPPISKIHLVTRAIAALIFVIVGGLLVILRPSSMTWGFFFYCLGFSPGIALGGFARFPSPVSHTVFVLLTDVLSAAGTAGILVFSLQFLCENPSAWRRAVERAVPYIFISFVFLIAYPDLANLVIGRPAETVQRVMLALQGVVFGLSIVAALQTYLHGKPENRPRIQWVVVGLCVGIIGTYLGSVLLFSSVLPFNPPRWLQSSLLTLNVFLPIAVAYAVIRHRVLEVSFVVSRALIYGVLTFLVLSLFAFIDWLVGQELEAVRLAAYVSIAVAIGLSFWLNALERRVETVIASVFFRRRREAMLRIQRAADAVSHAAKIPTVLDYLVREPVEAFALSSAALFLPASDGGFRRVLARGWSDSAISTIEHDDPLSLELAAECEPVRVAEIGWQPPDLPSGDKTPILAIPMLGRHELLGIALYGPHANGADIDPEEVRSLNHLARAAQASYDHLHAIELAEELATLKAQLASLQAKASELTR